MNGYENVIIADADYLDKVAFDLIVNFERMLMRRIPPADIARWIDCVALDGGMRPAEGDQLPQTHVVLVHGKETTAMENFTPAAFSSELNGKAFKDNLGEFTISALPVEPMAGKDDFLLDIITTVCQEKEVRRVMIVTDADNEEEYNRLREALRHIDDDNKRITVFAMQPLPGGNFRQEILGYSLMNALGISADEINRHP